MAIEPLAPPAPVARPGSHCRHRAAPRREGDLRPTDVVGAFFVCGLAFLLAAAVVAVVQAVAPWPWGRWLALHLAFVGGVSQLVVGASQFFVGAFLTTDPPPRRLVRGQLLAWNVGAIVLAVAVPQGSGTAIWFAVGLLLASLGLWSAAIATMWRRSLRRSTWAVAWYVAGALFLGLGVTAGSLLAHGDFWSGGDLLGAHMALNLAGWFGGAIVGTLHTFYPSLTQTRLRHPRLQGLAFGAWSGGVVALAVGYAWGVDPLAVAGWLALCLGALLLLVNVVACLRAAPRPLSLAARVVGAAQPFLLVALVIATVAAFAHGPEGALAGSTRIVVGTLLVTGWVGLTVLGSLFHLLAVVLRVRGGHHAKMPAARPRFDGPVAVLAMVAVAALALAQGAGLDGLNGVARVLLLVAYALLAGRVAQLAGRVLVRARPSI